MTHRTFKPERLALGVAAAIALVLMLVFARGSRAADGEGLTPDSRASVDSYLPDRQAAVWRAACDGSDSIANVASLTDTITPFSIAGAARRGARQNLSLSCRFSDSAATATIWVAYYYYDGSSYVLLGVDQPFAAGAVTDISATTARETTGGAYLAHTYTFDSFGATHAVVAVTAVSAGTVDLWLGSY